MSTRPLAAERPAHNEPARLLGRLRPDGVARFVTSACAVFSADVAHLRFGALPTPAGTGRPARPRHPRARRRAGTPEVGPLRRRLRIDLDPFGYPIVLDDERWPALVVHAGGAVQMCPQLALHLVDREPERTGGHRR